MRASVIVPAWQAADTLPACLDGLARQDADGFEVLVVDDGSTDGTAEIAERAGVRLLRTDRLGPVGARNRGAAEASGDVLAFTDADCVPEPGWLSAGMACIEEGFELVQGLVRPARPHGPWERTISVGAEIGLYETANLFLRRSAFERVGGFEKPFEIDLGVHFGEDLWLAWRARRAGARSTFCAQAVVEHAVFPRGPGGYLAELRRRRYFPQIAALVPELRDTFFHRRVFLSARSAAFDLALAGAAAALVSRSPLPLAAALPYARRLRADALAWRDHESPARVAAVQAAGDAVTLAALVRGSLAARTLVL